MSKYYLSFQTTFILNENIKWLEEFLLYYINLGFDHFYLYDNDKSSGGDGTQNKNKYDFDISTNNSQEDKLLLDNIMKKYGDYITYILWQPKNNLGEVVYGQNEAIYHFIQNYGGETEWVAFMDLDEFIFSEKNINLRYYLNNLDNDVSCIKLIQKKFIDRFLASNKLITQDYRCINDLNIGYDWGPKNIIRTKNFKYIHNIHNIDTKGKTIHIDKTIFRFNHYNLNQKQLSWMKWYYGVEKDFKIDGVDDGMIRYKNYLNYYLYNDNIKEYYGMKYNKPIYCIKKIIMFMIVIMIIVIFLYNALNIK
jgi:hypothetical protein